MKHVLVTGIGGSFGCHLLIHLVKNTDWEIVGLDSFRHKGLTDRLPDWVTRLPRVRIFSHDLVAPISRILAQRIGKVDYIINLAAISDVDMSLDEPTIAVRNNVDVMLTMLEYARACKPETFIQVSTDEVYGPTDGNTAHPEWSPIVPSNPYSASKACQEALAIAWWRSYAVPLTVINLMNMFGEMQNGAKFPCIVQREVRAGRTIRLHKFGKAYGTRYYIHSRNAADALLFLLRRGPPHQHVPGQVDRPDRYNIVGDRQVDNLALARLIADALGKELKYEDEEVINQRPGHDGHYGLDGAKLAALGWKSPMSFEDSMRKTIAWYEQNETWLDPK